MYLFITPSETIDVDDGLLPNDYVDGTVMMMQEAILMKTAQDTLIPWTASQSDVLADDWELVP